MQIVRLSKFMEWRKNPENTKWKTISEDPTPFPEPVKELSTQTITISKLPKTSRK